MRPLEFLHAHLQRQRISRTKARDHIYLALGRFGPCPPSVLARELVGEYDRATIYRTLKVFVGAGVAVHPRHGLVEIAAPFKQHHHHLVCEACGREISFNDTRLEQALERFVQRRGFRLTTHHVELIGRCALCLER